MATLRDQISAVTVASPVDVAHPPRPAPGPAPVYPCLMPGCTWRTTDIARWRTHVLREVRNADPAELERLAYRRVRRRFPGDGSISPPRRTAAGQVRYDIQLTTRDPDGTSSRHTRRTNRARQPMTTRDQAEDALDDALAHGVWNRPPAVPPPAQRKPRRLALGLSIKETARRAGVDPKTIRNWEAGAPPAGDRARRYAAVLARGGRRAAA